MELQPSSICTIPTIEQILGGTPVVGDRAGDGLHAKEMKVSGLPSKEKAIEAWNRRANDGC